MIHTLVLRSRSILLLGKISATVLTSLLGTTAIAALIGIGSTMLFGLQGAKFTQGAAETARISELATRQETVENLSIPQQILSFIPKKYRQRLQK